MPSPVSSRAVSPILPGSTEKRHTPSHAPCSRVLLNHYDWRATYLAIGVAVLIINVALVANIVRGDPESMGQRPFGADDDVMETTRRQSTQDFTLSEALRTRSLWLFLIAMFVCGGGDFLISTHLIPWVTDDGVSAATAADMLAWHGLLSLAGLLVVGPVSDVIGNKAPIALTFLIRIALFILVLSLQTPAVFYTFALAFGFTHLMTAPLTPTLVGKLFGFSNIGVIAGLVTTVHHLSGGFWTYMGGLSFDLTGSYRLAFVVSAVLAFVALICSLLIHEARHAR